MKLMKTTMCSMACIALALFTWYWAPCLLCAQENSKLVTLAEAIDIALERNAGLRAARQQVKASDYRVKRARRDLFPKADLQLDYARLDAATVRRGNVFVDVGRSLVETFDAGDPNDIRPNAYDNNFATKLQVVQPIYNGGAQWAAVGMARAQKESDENLLEDTRQETVLKVKQSYFRVLQAHELLALAQRSLEATREHLESARHMLRVGIRSRTNVLRWEVQAATQEGSVLEADGGLANALAALKYVLGLSFDHELSVAPYSVEPDSLTTLISEELRRAKLNHPQLKRMLSSVDAAHSAVRMAWAGFQPRLNFVYQLGWERNSTLALDSFSYWNAGLTLSLPLFHSFSNMAHLQENKAEAGRLEELVVETERLVELQVITARTKVRTSLKKYHIALKAAGQARENLKSLDNAYAVGLAANMDVIDGQVVLTEAEAQVIRARYDYWIARAELERALGGLDGF